MKKLIFLGCFAFSMAFFGCGGDADTEDDTPKKKDTTASKPKAGLSPEVIKDIIGRIPNPTETSSLIKDMGVKYDATLLSNPDNSSKYNTDYRKALNLGIYSTDLGYANIYEQSQDAISFLTGVKDMADGLQIGKFFDFDKIKELAASSDKLDQLMEMTQENLQKMNEQLQQNDRTDMTVLIITGGWVETLYLTVSVAKKQRNKDLETKIADQKIVLDQLVLLINHYETSPKMKALKEDFMELEKIYEQIKVTYTKGDHKAVEKNGQLVVEGSESSDVQMTQENLDGIYKKISDIRNKMVN
jgi:hypothetical protein